MVKTATILIAFNMLALSSFSQTVKQKIDKEHTEANKANAAKADVLMQKKTVFDSTVHKNNGTRTPIVKHVIHKKRKNKMHKRKKHLSR